MNTLQETLIYLINHRLFASSPTAFGKLFAEKDRNRGIRILNGTTTNFDSTLEKFDEVFDLQEEDLRLYVEADKLATSLYHSIGGDSTSKEESYKFMKAIMEEKYRKVPSDFKPCIPFIKDLKCARRKYYLVFMALFFLKVGGYKVYHKGFSDDYLKVWEDFKEYLKIYDPKLDDLHKIAECYISNEIYREVCHKSIWGIIEHLLPVLDIADNPKRLEAHLRNYHLFDWEEDSYWIYQDEKFTIGESKFFWMGQIDTNLSDKGFYHVVSLQSGKNKEEFYIKSVYALSFLDIGDYEGYRFMVYLTDVSSGKVTIGVANFDEETSQLHLNFDEETEFPPILQMIDRVSPTGRESKVWKRIIDVFEEKAYDRIYLQYLNKVGNFELLDNEMEVVDIQINRKEIVISVQDLCTEEKTTTDYRISLDKQDFLKTLTPCEDIEIVRKNEDGKLYFWWVDRNIRLCLEEFER